MTRIAVVTPYCTEDAATLRHAHDSVLAQTVPCTHILVADGHPKPEPSDWQCRHIVLPEAHRDVGSFARGCGALEAVNKGFDYIAFLDADNWYEPDHIESLLELARARRTAVTTSARSLRRLDGTLLAAIDRYSDGRDFADTNTLFLHREAYDIAALWASLPAELGAIGDRVVWAAVQTRRYATAHTGKPTVNYRTRYAVSYTGRGEEPPAGTIDLSTVEEALRIWKSYDVSFRRRLVLGFRDAIAAEPIPAHRADQPSSFSPPSTPATARPDPSVPLS